MGMANAFDEAWNSAASAEKAVFGGEHVFSGAAQFEVVVLEFDRRRVIGAIGGATSQVAGQVVMARADWLKLVPSGKTSVAVKLRGHSVRLEEIPESPDLDNVTLNVIAPVAN